jgi:hypothetical protein
MTMATLLENLDRWLEDAPKRLASLTLQPIAEAFGRVEDVGDGIAWVSGLPGTRLEKFSSLRAASAAWPSISRPAVPDATCWAAKSR